MQFVGYPRGDRRSGVGGADTTVSKSVHRGLHLQVGAICRGHSPDRDSSLVDGMAPGTSFADGKPSRPPGVTLVPGEPGGNVVDALS